MDHENINLENLNLLNEKQIIKLYRKFYVEDNVDSIKNLFEFSLNKFSNSDKLCFECGNFFYEQKNLKEAKLFIEKSIKLNPNKNPQKYFIMGEILEFPENLNYYENGIKITINHINILQNLLNKENDNKKIKKLKKKIKDYNRNIAQTYSAVGEINLNNNKLKDAYNNFILSIKFDKYYLEPYYQLIFYSMKIIDYEKYKEYVKNFISILKEIKKENIEELKDYNYEIFYELIRNMQESELFEESLYLCEIVLNNEVNNPDVLYLYVFSNYNLNNYSSCLDTIEKIKEFNLDKNDEIYIATMEIYDLISENEKDKMIEETDDI